jgi:membrane protease YdiL (CAAX protease family)
MTDIILLQFAEWAGVVAVTLILTLIPAFKRRPLIFKYPTREGWVALGLVALVGAAMWAIYASTPLLTKSPKTGKDLAFTLEDLSRQAGVYALLLAPLTALLFIRRQPLLSTGLGKQTLRPSLYLGFALALITIFLRGKTYTILNGGVTPAHIYFLLAVLVTTFVEEFIFRGFVQPRLSAWIGDTWGWLATAVLFTLWRLPQMLLVSGGVAPAGLALNLAVTLGMGLVLGWVMRKSGNILAPWLYHAIASWVAVL